MHGCPPPQTPTGQSAGQASPSWIICWLTPDTFMSLTHRLTGCPQLACQMAWDHLFCRSLLWTSWTPSRSKLCLIDPICSLRVQIHPLAVSTVKLLQWRLCEWLDFVIRDTKIVLIKKSIKPGTKLLIIEARKGLWWKSHHMRKTSLVKLKAISEWGRICDLLTVNFSAVCPACVLMKSEGVRRLKERHLLQRRTGSSWSDRRESETPGSCTARTSCWSVQPSLAILTYLEVVQGICSTTYKQSLILWCKT